MFDVLPFQIILKFYFRFILPNKNIPPDAFSLSVFYQNLHAYIFLYKILWSFVKKIKLKADMVYIVFLIST